MWGAPMVSLALFWLAASSFSSVPWPVPMMSGLFLGCGLICVFLSLIVRLPPPSPHSLVEADALSTHS